MEAPKINWLRLIKAEEPALGDGDDGGVSAGGVLAGGVLPGGVVPGGVGVALAATTLI